MDGGVRRGTDVFKALALGASGVFVSIQKFYGLKFAAVKIARTCKKLRMRIHLGH
jgi:isopentenyl diphosphate isomerase/L-lactate dehydrogenase-like FMN-dependent dehydrogenase